MNWRIQMNEIYQHNFKTIKPDSIFTSMISNPQMNEDIEKEIRDMGDKQDHKTNVKAQMTEWNMEDKPGFNLFSGNTSHGVKENLSDEERIAVSFNVKEDHVQKNI